MFPNYPITMIFGVATWKMGGFSGGFEKSLWRIFKNHRGELLNLIYLTCEFLQTIQRDKSNFNVGEEG